MPEKKEGKSKKKRSAKAWISPLIFFGIWLVLLVPTSIFVWEKLNEKQKRQEAQLEYIQFNERAMQVERERVIKKKKREKLEKELIPMGEMLRRFFATRDTADRYAFVFDSAQQAAVMTDFYKKSIAIGDGKTGPLVLKNWDVFEKAERTLVGTVWKQEGDELAVVYVNTDSGWLIDWRFLERYSGASWKDYFSQEASENLSGEVVMRGYLRKRAVQNENKIEVSIHEPLRGIGDYTKEPMANFSIDQRSELGRQLVYVFDYKGAVGGHSFFKNEDSDYVQRVTVRLKKSQKSGSEESEIELVELLSTNWLDEALQEDTDIPDSFEELEQEKSQEDMKPFLDIDS